VSSFHLHACVAACCIVVQCVAVSAPTLILRKTYLQVGWSVLQCVAVCCSVMKCVAVCCIMLQCVAVCGSVLQSVAVWCSVLQCGAVCCSVLN